MVRTVPGRAQDHHMLPAKLQTEQQRDLRVRSIVYRIKLPDRNPGFIAVIGHDFLRRAVKIPHDIVRKDLVLIQKDQSAVRRNDKFCLFTFQNLQNKCFLQQSPADDHRTFTHIL